MIRPPAHGNRRRAFHFRLHLSALSRARIFFMAEFGRDLDLAFQPSGGNDMEIRGEFACLSSAWSNIWDSLASPGLDNIEVGKLVVFGSNPKRPGTANDRQESTHCGHPLARGALVCLQMCHRRFFWDRPSPTNLQATTTNIGDLE